MILGAPPTPLTSAEEKSEKGPAGPAASAAAPAAAPAMPAALAAPVEAMAPAATERAPMALGGPAAQSAALAASSGVAISALAEQLIVEAEHIAKERYGKSAEGTEYFFSHLRELLLQPGKLPAAAVLEEVELTLDHLEDVIEALGVEEWT